MFRVSHLMGAGAMAMEEDRWDRVRRDLERVIKGEQDIAALVAFIASPEGRLLHGSLVDMDAGATKTI